MRLMGLAREGGSMSVLWTKEDAVAATSGQAFGDWSVSGVSIDTRELEQGDLFVALKDVRDGHDFVAQACNLGPRRRWFRAGQTA